MKSFAVIALVISPSICNANDWNMETCVSALESAYQPFKARTDASTTGDFDSDGKNDFAVILDKTKNNQKSAIGVCLSIDKRPLLITAPYQSTKIFTKPKGTAYMDFDTEKGGIYDRDVISVSDGAWIGASYALRGGIFVQIIDGD